MNVDASRTGAGSGTPPSKDETPRPNASASDAPPAAPPGSSAPAQTRLDRDDVSQDDRDVGWGESPRPTDRDDEWYRRERPPHHG